MTDTPTLDATPDASAPTAATDLSPLDRLIRTALATYPTLYQTRWDVLSNLYLGYGHGYEWQDGALVQIFEDGRSDTPDRAAFFADIDRRQAGCEAEMATASDWLRAHIARQMRGLAAERARRAFQFANLDLLVHEKRRSAHRSISARELSRSMSTTYSPIATLPEALEPSFRAGALELLDELIPALHYDAEAGTDLGLRAFFLEIRQRLSPPADPAFLARFAKELIAEIGAEEAASAGTADGGADGGAGGGATAGNA